MTEQKTEMGNPVYLTEAERQLVIAVLVKLPIQVTLETLPGNKTIAEIMALVEKFKGQPALELP